MSFAKYSPTVWDRYQADQKWFKKNCADPNDLYDKDGYDSYGYDRNGRDRAGRTEWDYESTEYADGVSHVLK